MARMEFKRVSSLETGEAGTFQARVAVTGNVDRFGDRILPGAFTETLASWAASGRKIPVLYAHNWSTTDGILGGATAHEDETGLVIDAQLNLKRESARVVYDALKAGEIGEFSFAFEAKDFRMVHEGGADVRELLAVDLFEVGPCVMGVNPDTELLTVKAGRLALDPDPLTLAQALLDGVRAEKKAGHTPPLAIVDLCRAVCAEVSPPPDPPITIWPVPVVVTPSAKALDHSWIARCAALLPGD